ncbi:uncharacterized protein LOC143923215 [Arctopsyche grandis]|uniref:uncharacterized protein LOC143923215 n=1 Tax=Arctopsyche grandis TaxID=121162 RepID=UPI00406D7DE2
MGGCRCSYKTCNKVTDGKTHFFHYPVRDENRCNQWIIHSNRLDLKSVTRSQLKNKVVCEKHFPEQMFMNYKHERLVHTAVPIKEHVTDTPEDDNPLKKEIKSFAATKNDAINEEVTSTVMGTDVMSINKEMSTMSVNVSSITGLSFFPPHEKKSNSAPYIELLTRLHNNPLLHSSSPKTITLVPKKSSASKELSKAIVSKRSTTYSEFHKEDQFNDIVKVRKNDIITAELKKSRTIGYRKVNETNKPAQEVQKRENNSNVIKNIVINKKRLSVTVSNSAKETASLKLYKPQPMVTESSNVVNSNSEPAIVDNDVSIILDKDINIKSAPKFSKNSVQNSKFNLSFQKFSESAVDPNKNSNDRISNGDIIILPMAPNMPAKVSKYCNLNMESSTQTPVQSEQANFLAEGKKMLTELKTALNNQREMKKRMDTRRLIAGRIKKKQFRPLSKPSLYAQIVPFLSPSTALLVHKEMFPSMRHMHRS